MLELLAALAIMLVVTAGVVVLVGASEDAFAAESEAADMQQRLRVAAGALFKDVVMAGAGVYHGERAGSLAYYFASVLPFR